VELIKPNTKIDFVGYRRYAYLFSAIMTILAVASIPLTGGIQFGIDFTGGLMMQVRFSKTVSTEEIRETLKPVTENLIVQALSGGEQDYIIRLEAPEKDSEQLSNRIKDLLEAKIGKGTVNVRGVEMVGPKVGKDLRQAAMYATVIALVLMFIYVGFRFYFSVALGALLCLIHDVVMIYGIWVWTGKEFNLTILAAILTIVGYDVHDTIVVSDRIRENLHTMRGVTVPEILNASLNQTLSRTVLTSGFTMLVVLAMLIVGTHVLRDFAWALAIGIFFGTYSSIFVATPLVLAWDKIIPLKRA
jgi:preprotein translocase subunit SecF